MATLPASPIIALHPEAVPEAPQQLRWVLPADVVPFTGPVHKAPSALATLCDNSVIVHLVFESTALLITLTEGASWRQWGEHVREATSTALKTPELFTPQDARQLSLDYTLMTGVQEVLAGTAGDYVRSHGGGFRVQRVRDGCVTVEVEGACRGCPALGNTLTHTIEKALRQQCPQLRELICVSPPPTSRPRPTARKMLRLTPAPTTSDPYDQRSPVSLRRSKSRRSVGQ